MTPDETAALFARRGAAFIRRDSVAVSAEYAENCRLDSPTWGTVVGRAAVAKAAEDFVVAFPDITFEFDDPLISGDHVVQTVTVWGTDTGGFLGQAPTQKQFRFFIVSLCILEDRKILYERRVFDVNGLLLQLATDSASTAETSQRYRAALDRTRLEQEVRIAAEIQQALLPHGERKGIGFEIAAASVPCRAIGGDFFDYFDLPDGSFGFALGDVSGKGPPAALLAAQLQGIFVARSSSDAAPADTVTSVNRLLVRRAIESRFATVVYAVLSGDGLLTYCNAGHNPPLLIREDGVHQLTTGGLILGAFTEARFEQEALRLRPGDMLVVFSDGVTEAVSADGDEFGEERLSTCMNARRDLSAAALLEYLFRTVGEFSAGADPNDDRTALVLRYTGVEPTTA